MNDIQQPTSGQIEEWLVQQVANHANLSMKNIDVKEPFVNYGIDSAIALLIATHLEEFIGHSIPSTVMWEYPNIYELSKYLGNERTEKYSSNITPENKGEEPVAIVGMACRFPGANNLEEYWELLSNGMDAITEVPSDRFNVEEYYDSEGMDSGKMFNKYGGFIQDIDKFDYRRFGFTPREAAYMDPQQRVLLELSWEALENAGIDISKLYGSKTGVFMGASTNDYSQLINDREGINPFTVTGNALSVISNRVSYSLDLKGPSVTVDTACSSSLVSVEVASQNILSGNCEMAIAGGVNIILTPHLAINYSQTGILSRYGRCRTFDAQADGFVRGEGAGVIVLKRLSQALKDNDRIYGLIKGGAINQDGKTNGIMAPNQLSQVAVMKEAFHKANISPGEIEYIEAHGTATSVGDRIEAEAISKAVGEDRDLELKCLIGSVKTNIGHLEAAAGIAGVIKVALSLWHQRIPPSLHFNQPNDDIPFDQLPIKVQTDLSSWRQKRGRQYAGISSFGFAGTNCHLILSDYEETSNNTPETSPIEQALEKPQIITLSAVNDHALKDFTGKILEELKTGKIANIADLAYSVNVRRMHHEHRMALTFTTREELISQLEQVKQGKNPFDIAVNEVTNKIRRDIAFVFSGMDKSWKETAIQLFEKEEVFRKQVEKCDKVFRELITGQSIIVGLLQDNGLFEEHNPYSQAVIFSVQVALVELWKSWGIEPKAVLGQGLGEISAAYVSGIINLRDAMLLAVQQGHLTHVDAGHAPFVRDGNELEKKLEEVSINPSSTNISFYSSETTREMEGIELDLLNCHAFDYTKFNQTINRMLDNGLTAFVEISSHPSLVENIENQLNIREIDGISVSSLYQGKPYQALFTALGNLYTRGHSVKWDQVYTKGNVVSYPAYPWQHERCWIPENEQNVQVNTVDKEAFWDGVVQTGKKQSEQAPLDLHIAQYDTAMIDIEKMVVNYIVEFFVNKDIFTTSMESYTLDELVDQLSFPSRYIDVLSSWLEHLCKAGYVERHGHTYINTKRFYLPDNEKYSEKLYNEYHSTKSLLDLIKSFGGNLTKIMQDEMDPLEIMFPEGSFSIMEEIYQYSAEARYFNNIVSALVEKIVLQRNRPLRILELGAGTGATTSFIVPNLSKEHSYTYTDISSFFIAHAKQKFQEYPLLEYNVLDVEQDPKQQGYNLHSYDIIIGANVLHATENLDITMKNVRSLLASGGYLLIWEVTQDQPWFDITFSLIDGWQRHNDRWRTNSPLLSTKKWSSLLEKSGFKETIEFPEDNSTASRLGQNIIVARGPMLNEKQQYKKKNVINELSNEIDEKEQNRLVNTEERKVVISELYRSDPNKKKEIILDFFKNKLAYLLGIPQEEIAEDVSVYSLGFDSMLALELRNIIIKELNTALELSSFLNSPTIIDLSNNVIELIDSQDSKINYKNNNTESTPLSYGQKSMWVMHYLEQESSLYNVNTALKINHTIDQEAFKKAIHLLVDRHQALRTTFPSRDNDPIQLVHEKMDIKFECVDVSTWSKKELYNVLNQEARKPFNIVNGPLWRARLYSVSENEHYFFLSMHHIITDGWSMWIFMYELNDIYEAETKNLQVELPTLPLQYTEYTNWMYQELLGQEGKEMQKYWSEKLQNVPHELTLNFQKQRPSSIKTDGAKKNFRLSKEQSKQLVSFSESNGLTPYMTLLSTFGTLMYLYSKQKEFVIGSPVSGRTHPDFEGLMGYFINMLPIRLKMDENLAFKHLLNQVKNTVLEAYDNQVYPFSLMVNDLQVPRDPSRSPLFQVAFVWQQAHKSEAKQEGLAPFFLEEAGMMSKQGALQMESIPLDHNVSLFDLTLKMAEGSSDISGMVEYSTDLYEEDHINQLISDFKVVLDMFLNAPDSTIEEFEQSVKLIR
jgi:acyl transferase domain-containing protein/SAM-dependent methyltransferase/acyl carrier protein